MKIVRDLSKAIVTKKGENSILNGHPWVFEGEIKDISNEYINAHEKLSIYCIKHNNREGFYTFPILPFCA